MVVVKNLLTLFVLFMTLTTVHCQYWKPVAREHLSWESYVQGSYNIIGETDTTLTDGIWGTIGAQWHLNKFKGNEFGSHVLFNIGYFSRWDTRNFGKQRNYTASIGYGINDEDYLFATGIVTYFWHENALGLTLEGKVYPFDKVFFDKVNLAFTLGFTGYSPLDNFITNFTGAVSPGINLNFKIR